MPTSYHHSSIVGSPTETGWSQLYEYEPEDSVALSQKGRLIIGITLHETQESESFISRSIFAQLKDRYYSSSNDPLESLKSAVSSVSPLLESNELFVCSSCQDSIFCVVANGSCVALLRNGVYTTLLTSREHQIVSLSGQVKPKDIFVFGSNHFFETIPQETLQSYLSADTLDTVGESLRHLIRGQEEGLILGYFLKADAEEAQKEEFPIVTEEPLEEPVEIISQKRWNTRNILHRNSLTENPIYVKEDTFETPRRKTPIITGLILVLFLVGTIIWGAKQKEKREKEEYFQAQISTIEAKLDESVNLAHINPERSRELFADVQESVLGISTEGHPEEVSQLTTRLKEVQEDILGERPVDLTLFVDLSLLSDGFSVSMVNVDMNNVYIFDTTGKRIAEVSLSTKRAEIMAGPSVVDGVSAIATYADTIYGLKENKIIELNPQKEVVNEGFDDALLSAYAGNLYVLNRQGSEIYRYTRGASAFSSKARWLSDGITTDLSDTKQWIIDGSIWVLKGDSTILRFTNGTYWEFTPQGVFPDLTNITSLYTGGDTEYLYILDANEGRIVVLTKQGEFQTQYSSEELKSAKFIVAQEKDKKMFIFTEDKVYSMETGE